MYRLVVIDDEYLVVEGIKAMIARQKLNMKWWAAPMTESMVWRLCGNVSRTL